MTKIETATQAGQMLNSLRHELIEANKRAALREVSRDVLNASGAIVRVRAVLVGVLGEKCRVDNFLNGKRTGRDAIFAALVGDDVQAAPAVVPASALKFTHATNNTMNAGQRERGMVYHFERGDVNYQAHAPHGGHGWQVVTICASSGDGRAWRWAKDLTKGIAAEVLARAMELDAKAWEIELPVQRWRVLVDMGLSHGTVYVRTRGPKGAMLKAQRIAGHSEMQQRFAVNASIADDQSGPCDDEPKAEQTAPADVAASSAVTAAEVIALRDAFDSLAGGRVLLSGDEGLTETGADGRTMAALLGELLTHRAARGNPAVTVPPATRSE